jgi:protein-L-isoaspartate(D-aspartate) O-methyltransferase
MIFNRKTADDGGRAASAAEEGEVLRRAMVREQIRDRGIHARNVLDAMLAVPRHLFVPEEFRGAAYSDQPLPIGEGQTISQPFMVAAMTAALELAGRESALEIGTGSGYQAAVLSLLARELHTVERSPSLAERAAERLARLGYGNVHVHAADGTLGWAEAAPYDAIIVTAAAPQVPMPLVEQLADGGRLVIPVGDEYQQELLLVRKTGEQTTSQVLHYCRFVPLVGRHGWHEPIL